MHSNIRLSIIVPCFNASETLALCLNSIFAQIKEGDEVTVVNDASTDQSQEIIDRFPVKCLTNDRNLGAGVSRHKGVEASINDYLLFIDSDVVIKDGQLESIRQFLSFNPQVSLTCLVDDNPKSNFHSDYKNLQLHYHFLEAINNHQSYLYGSLFAIRKEDYLPWPENLVLEDVVYHSRLLTKNINTTVDPCFQVNHLKKYSLVSLFSYEHLMGKYYGVFKLSHISRPHSTHVQYVQLLSLALTFFTLCCVFISLPTSIMALFGILLINSSFLTFCLRKRGYIFLLKSIFQIYISYLAYCLGLLEGFLKYRTLKKEFS